MLFLSHHCAPSLREVRPLPHRHLLRVALRFQGGRWQGGSPCALSHPQENYPGVTGEAAFRKSENCFLTACGRGGSCDALCQNKVQPEQP